MQKIKAIRYHDISAGHRVYGHENKCNNLHGHNYRIHFHLEAEFGLDELGRVIDFGVIKEKLCSWLEEHWDHKFLLWKEDPLFEQLRDISGVISVPFNPTAENMASFILSISPRLLEGTSTRLVKCVIEETRKCSVEVEQEDPQEVMYLRPEDY